MEVQVKRNADGERYTLCTYQHGLAVSCNECCGKRLVEVSETGEKTVITEKF